jgi:hypothetical protein
LVAAAALDYFFPGLHGIATFLAAGAATYVAAQEFCDLLTHRKLWTQESLATALALSVAGFLYFWWRNDSDLILLGLSIGLMMASLMVAISIIGSFGAAIKEGSARPVAGLLLTIAGAIILGCLAGLLALISSPSGKLWAIGIGIILWKTRENVRPPQPNALSQPPVAPPAEQPASPDLNAAAVSPHGRVALIPQRGTLLDRFLPVLILGALLFIALKQTNSSLGLPAAPASADNNSASNSNPPAEPAGESAPPVVERS